MITKQEITQFYADVDKLGLKFPGAAIVEATGESKGNVSKYLNKKKQPSESFLKRFYEKFPKGSKIVSRETETHKIMDGQEEPLDPRLLEVLQTISIAHKEHCEAVNKMADNENRILSRLPATVNADVETTAEIVATVFVLRQYVIQLASAVRQVPDAEISADFDKKVKDRKNEAGSKDRHLVGRQDNAAM